MMLPIRFQGIAPSLASRAVPASSDAPRTALLALVLGGGLLLMPAPLPAATPGGGHVEKPYGLEAIPGSEVKRIVLTEKAARRLDIKTGQISQDPAGRLIAPFDAIFYDLKGVSWVYTSPVPLTFVRHKVVVTRVDGPHAFIGEGPPDGTRVVTLGVSELYGTERGIGH